MPIKIDLDAIRRSAENASLVDPGSLVRETLARTLEASGNRQQRLTHFAATTGVRRQGEGAANRSMLGLQHAIDRLSALKPDVPLCETTIQGRRPVSVRIPKGATFEERVFRNATGVLGYRVYVPNSAVGRTVPLVVMLHGCTQSPEDFAAGTRMNEVAEERVFIVAYPRQTQTANLQRCWNWFETKDQHRDAGEPALIAGITREILGGGAVDPTRVYVAGLSAGGAAAAIMGQAYPDLYAAVGVHSGLAAGSATDLPSALAAMQKGGARRHGRVPVPTIVFHGDHDRTVHPVNGDEVLAQAGAAASLDINISHGRSAGGLDFTKTARSDRSGRTMFEHWALHSAGHAWSGGSPDGSYTEPRGPDASREMARFFFQHSNRTVAS